MKKILGAALFVLVSAALVMVLRAFFPKNAGMLSFFFLFLLFDGYLWLSVRRLISGLKPVVRAILTVLYMLPMAMVAGLIIYGSFESFLDWNLPFRTYVQNLVLVLFLVKVFPAITLLLADLTRAGRYLAGLFAGKPVGFNAIPRYRPLLLSGWLLGMLLMIMMVAGTLFGQFDFQVHRQEVALKGLPPSFVGLRIVQFSDVHLGSWGSKEKLAEAVKEMNDLQPDVIFFTGDMFNYGTADGRGFEPILKNLHAPLGVYAIMGNHDYGDYLSWPSAAAKQQNMEDLKGFYRNLGWKLLLNTHDIIKRGYDSIAILGVENWGSSHRFQRLGDVDKAQKGTENMAVRLLLSHDPSHWDSIVSKKYQDIGLTFSGHTHGGQVGISMFHIHWSPIAWAYREWCGLYSNPASPAPQYLYVNQGLGNIGYSGRIGILPEITLIILKRVP